MRTSSAPRAARCFVSHSVGRRKRNVGLTYTCSNAKCRAVFSYASGEQVKHMGNGLCQKCLKAVRKRKPKVLDPELAAQCRAIAAEEKLLFDKGRGRGSRGDLMARYERAALARLDDAPQRLSPLEAERYLGGPSPGGKSGKVGGPSGREG